MADRYGGTGVGTPMPVDVHGRRVDHPTYGLVAAGLGAALAVFGFAVLDWAIDASFGQIRATVDLHRAGYALLTQVYLDFAFFPVAVVVIAAGACAAAGRTAARLIVAAGGVLGGGALVVTVGWVASGAPGAGESRTDSALALILTAGVGLGAIAGGAAAYADRRGRLARGLTALLATTAAGVHCYVVTDVFAGAPRPEFGAWAPAVGYGLLALASVLPYRRLLHA